VKFSEKSVKIFENLGKLPENMEKKALNVLQNHMKTRGDRSHFFDSCSCSQKMTPVPAPELWNFTLQLMFALRNLEGSDYFAS